MFLKYGICIAVLVLLVIRFDKVFSWFSQIWNVAFPLILGCLVAYVLNIIMKVLENHWFPDTNSRVALRARRGVCVFLSIFLVFGVIFLIIRIVLPELVQAFSVMADEIPVYFEKIQDWIVDNGDLFPSLAERIGAMEINWQEMFNKIFTYVTSGFSSMLNSAFSFISHILSSVVNIAIATIFAVYILMNKEKLQSQVKTLQKVYMKKPHMKTVNHIIYTANECFTSFITGQCVEAVILGILCTVGMLILRFPYAPMVGTFIGATALIPMVGAYIGAVVGAFMIFTVSPIQSLAFLVFIVILQQLEGNLIYPKVVGASIGLPGIWVLAAVTIGGGLGGIPGMLIGVPLTATVYRLICLDVRERTRNESMSEDCKEAKE
ncbi:AI-2E family transporter [Frisingicoccus sp.]|uniref:AI-2E family transporter n=1 Tax=Frisingicoccus sp. TaxID=1918627 RepID=UPI003AB90129